jgi:hypothetical protein
MHQEMVEAYPVNPKFSQNPLPFEDTPKSSVQWDSTLGKSHQQIQNQTSILFLSKNHLLKENNNTFKQSLKFEPCGRKKKKT